MEFWASSIHPFDSPLPTTQNGKRNFWLHHTTACMRFRSHALTFMNIKNIVSCIFGIIFFIIGILNAFLVHIVPGVFYILLSFIYPPLTNKIIKKKLGFQIPFVIKIIVGLVILWGTLAVGDLMEMFESYLLNQ